VRRLVLRNACASIRGRLRFCHLSNTITVRLNQELADWLERYSDREPDLADLCLIRMSELFPKHPVITVDREDFRVYRRNKRESIPVICPP